MLTPAPYIPANLRKKLMAAARAVQREYDGMSFAEGRRLIGRHGFRMPVLCSLSFHGNGKLRAVNIRENLKQRAPSPRQFESYLTIFGSPEQGARSLLSACLHWIAENAAEKFLEEGRHQAFQMRDADIAALLRRLPEFDRYSTVDFGDVSLVAIRRVAESEQQQRRKESNHARVARHGRRPIPSSFVEQLEAERAESVAWREKRDAKGYFTLQPFEYRNWPEEDRTLLAFRERSYRDAWI